MTNPSNVRATAAQSQCALPGQAPAAPSGRRPTLTAVRPLGPKGVAPYVDRCSVQQAWAHDDDRDGPTVMDLRRAQARQPGRVDLYQFAVKAKVYRAQAAARALASVREHGPDYGPIA